MIDKKETGKRIREIRKSLHLNQEAFSNSLHISSTSISEIERGKFYPNIELLGHLAKIYNVNLYYVIFNVGEMFLDPAASIYHSNKKYAVNPDDIRKFLYYFERSPLFQYEIMSIFKTALLRNKELFEEEIEAEQSK